MEFEYVVTYSDRRLKESIKKITIKTANIQKWTEDFEKENSPWVKIFQTKFKLPQKGI